MFRELVPILEGRTLMLTLSRAGESAIRVCVVPKKVKEDTGENAICTPLVVTGTADELDSEFVAQLSRYTSSLTRLGSNLSAIEATHSAAVKAVEEEKKKDLDRKRGKSSGARSTTTTAEPNPGPAVKDGKPVFGTKNASGNAAPMTLFDAPAQEITAGQHEGADASSSSRELDQHKGECESSSALAPDPSPKAEAPGQDSGGSLPLSYPD